jgi:nitroreductase
MNVIESLKWRYATKKFDDKRSIPNAKIEIIKEAFCLTASSFGLQPVKLIIIENKDLQEQLVEHSMNQKQVAQASHLLVFCTENTVDEAYVNDYFKLVKEERQTPDDVLKPFRSYLIHEFKTQNTEDVKNWSTKQAYLAMGNLLTVCALEGIDACPMEGFVPEKYDELLNLKEKGLASVLAMPIGYRAEDDVFSDFKKVRKPIQESVINL